MRYVHNLTLSVFSDISEDQDVIRTMFEGVIPLDWKKAKIDYRVQNAQAYDHSTIYIHSVKIHKERQSIAVLNHIFEQATNVSWLYDHRLERLDEECCFYLRLDKDLLKEGEYVFVNHGRCVQIRIKLAAYPKNRTNAKKTLEELFAVLSIERL